ncbi:hypothetical protein BVRB_041500, partial [Beta vulgaris subsp. vulgaris]
EVDLSL